MKHISEAMLIPLFERVLGMLDKRNNAEVSKITAEVRDLLGIEQPAKKETTIANTVHNQIGTQDRGLVHAATDVRDEPGRGPATESPLVQG